ncbi:hypothetical protein KMS_R32090 [Pseudomonas sp. LRP2-20]|uniref:hypothetical protein n=1 Tax=Pseudomonas sp. LRP2-20 TaxID=2944234 RepID=UPI002189419C|nr:hypothetical protein [Pseudomonas sp. LRP2-20]BDM23452.1 hypothetical protein KMS_R32090 [Pseudomonas sp. LRP2-20]
MTAIKGYSLLCRVAVTFALSSAVSADSSSDAFSLTPGDKLIESSVNDCLVVYHTMNQRMLDTLSGFDVSIGDGVRLFPAEYKKAVGALKDFWDTNAHRYSANNSALKNELQALTDALTAANQRYLGRGDDEWLMKSLSRLHSDFMSERFRLREQLDDVTYAWAQCPLEKTSAATCWGEAIRQFEQYFQEAHGQLGKLLPRMMYARVPLEREWWVACRAPDFTGSR